jgi:hypothetical protein
MPHGPKWWETSKNPAIWRDGVRPGGLVTPAAAPGEKISGGGGNASGSARGSFQFLREAQRHPLAVGSSKRGGDTARGAPPNRRHPCMTHRREPPTSASAFQLRTPTTSTTTSQWSARPGHATLRRRSALLAPTTPHGRLCYCCWLLGPPPPCSRRGTSAQLDTE